MVLLRNTGAAISPFNAFLFLQGIETLPLRMERNSDNALAVARTCSEHPRSTGSTTRASRNTPYHAVAEPHAAGRQRRARHVRHRRRRSRPAGVHRRLELFSRLANIGDAKSLAIHPATTTHSQLAEDELDDAGVAQDAVRLSVGIEHIDDLLADLDQALARARGRSRPEATRCPLQHPHRRGSHGHVGHGHAPAVRRGRPAGARSDARSARWRSRTRPTASSNAARANAVFVCHALTGDAHAAGHHGGGARLVGHMIGPGKPSTRDRSS